jgi:MFS family permease
MRRLGQWPSGASRCKDPEVSAKPQGADGQDTAADDEAFAADFQSRTGMSQSACYGVVLLAMAFRTLGGAWQAMVILEYMRYYLINDISMLATVNAAAECPQCLLKAFLFPCWGVVADRVSRKRMLVLSSSASCISTWLLAVVPCIPVFVLTRVLTLVGDVGGSLRNAMLRDLFSRNQWDIAKGGVTGIQARLRIFGVIVTGVAVAVGMSVMKLGDEGIMGHKNEFTLRKGECKDQMYCTQPDHFSWGGGWRVDGSLRLIMLMAACSYTLELLVIVFLLPETLKQDYATGSSIWAYVWCNRNELLKPWRSLRVFATPMLRSLLGIRMIHYVIGSAGSAIFTTWYRRTELDTFTMYTLGVPTGIVGFLCLCIIPRLAERYGDFRGIWVPSNVVTLVYGVGVALVPGEYWQLCYVLFPLVGGPSAALAGSTPELLAKLVPPDLHGTFHTAKSFVWNVQRAIFIWPWLGALVVSEKYPYPFDALAIWIAIGLGVLALWAKLRMLPSDPRDEIWAGRALEDYWRTPYAREKCRSAPGYVGDGDEEVEVRVGEGASKAGLFLHGEEDMGDGLEQYLKFLTGTLPRKPSLSVVISTVKCGDLFESPHVQEQPLASSGSGALSFGTPAPQVRPHGVDATVLGAPASAFPAKVASAWPPEASGS